MHPHLNQNAEVDKLQITKESPETISEQKVEKTRRRINEAIITQLNGAEVDAKL